MVFFFARKETYFADTLKRQLASGVLRDSGRACIASVVSKQGDCPEHICIHH